jgi:uncharacterized protein (UPF0332 family)
MAQFQQGNLMKKNIDWFIQEGLLNRTPFISKLTTNYIEKAGNNLTTMSILSDLNSNKEVKKILDVPDGYDSSEWVVSCAYYAMYMAASAALAKISYRSKNHTATILALEEFFVKKNLLESQYLKMIEKAQLEKNHVEQLKLARDRREIAQYSVTKQTTRDIAELIKSDAYDFVARIEKLLDELG